MTLRHIATAAALLATTVYSSTSTSGRNILRANEVLSQPYATLAFHSADDASISRRADANRTREGIQVLPDGTIDLQAWEDETDKACKAALRSITESSNPSGNCICYNLPSLDAQTGVFEADLRLYRVSEPRGAFAGIAPGDVKVNLSYRGARASPAKPEEFKGAGMIGNFSSILKRADEKKGPTLVQSYLLLGKIDPGRIADNLTLSAFEILTLPTLTLSATAPNGQPVNTTVSLNEASFLIGVFSRHLVQSDFAAAQAAVDAQLIRLANGTVPFILPGTELMIFPIGLIITSVWLAIGLAAYGFGTYERLQYAAMYKARQKAASGL